MIFKKVFGIFKKIIYEEGIQNPYFLLFYYVNICRFDDYKDQRPSERVGKERDEDISKYFRKGMKN